MKRCQFCNTKLEEEGEDGASVQSWKRQWQRLCLSIVGGAISANISAIHHLAANDGEAGEDARAHDRLEALRDAGDVLLGHGAALDLLCGTDGRLRIRIMARKRGIIGAMNTT